MKKLTIITINFNHKEGLKRTIDSIVNQTFTDYEWIVVDGGSMDGSKELLEQYKDKFAWWCSEPDMGVYNAMNKGIAHATGEYINFMNSGDAYASSTILTELFSIPKTADIFYGQMTRETYDGELLNQLMMKPHIRWFDICHCGLPHQSEFSKRKLYDEKLFDETYKISADWEWNMYMIAVKRVTVEYIPRIISIYEGGGVSDVQLKTLEEEIQRMRQLYFSILQKQDFVDLHYLSVVNRFGASRCLYFLLTRTVNRLRRLCNVQI